MIKRVFKQMLFTQVISFLTVLLCMLIDSIMISRFLGTDCIVAYGLSTPVLLIFASFGAMLSAGIQVMMGKFIGTGDKEGNSACFSVAVVSTGIFVAVSLLAVFIFIDPVTTLLGAGKNTPDNPVFGLTKDYIIGFLVGAPPFLLAQILVPFLQISGKQSRVVIAVSLMIVSDITFDLLNVFVVKGGILGMGLASSLSYYVAGIFGIIYFFQKSCIYKFSFKYIKKDLVSKIFKNGIPTVINQISLVLFAFCLNKLLLYFDGNNAVACYSIISTIANICFSVTSGIGSVSLTLSSMAYAEEDRTACKEIIKIASFFSVVVNIFVLFGLALLAPYIVGVFLESGDANIEMTVHGMRLFSVCLVFSSFNSQFKNYYQGTGRVRYSELISILHNFALQILSAFIIGSIFGIKWIWLAFPVGEFSALVIIAVVAFINYGEISFSADAFSLLKDDFGVPSADLLEVQLSTLEDTVNCSQKAMEFCLEHGQTHRNSYVVALCVEEFCNNIIKHGFKRDKSKKVFIEFKLFIKNGKCIIRIRDNSHRFDPLLYVNLHQNDDPAKHIGMRMVTKMVTDAKYINSMNFNSLTLVI